MAVTGADEIHEAALSWLASPGRREAARSRRAQDDTIASPSRFQRRCCDHHLPLVGLRCQATRERVETFEVHDTFTGLVAAEADVAGLECCWLGPYAAVFDGDVKLAGRDAEGRLRP